MPRQSQTWPPSRWNLAWASWPSLRKMCSPAGLRCSLQALKAWLAPTSSSQQRHTHWRQPCLTAPSWPRPHQQRWMESWLLVNIVLWLGPSLASSRTWRISLTSMLACCTSASASLSGVSQWQWPDWDHWPPGGKSLYWHWDRGPAERSHASAVGYAGTCVKSSQEYAW